MPPTSTEHTALTPSSLAVHLLCAALLCAAVFCTASPCLASRATLLVPSKPSVESSLAVVTAESAKNQEPEQAAKGEAKADTKAKSQDKGDKAKSQDKNEKAKDRAAKTAEQAPAAPAAAQQALDPAAVCQIVDAVNASILASIAPQQLKEEVDLLIFGMEPFRYRGVAIDPPRIFTIYRFDRDAEDPKRPACREDRLGDIEEIRYLGQKAWGANVGLDRPGLYQFVIETQPWWSPSEAGYARHIVKTMLPVYGEDWGWDIPLGLSHEIVPLVRPFGLLSPALFSARVLVNGKPAPDMPVHVFRINTEKSSVPTPWHEEMELRTLPDGTFSVVLNKAGWWCCAASRPGEPLKGPDGQPSPLQESTLFWLYVDAQGK